MVKFSILFGALLSLCIKILPAVAALQDIIWLGLGPDDTSFTLRVISTGCTKKDDFSFMIDSENVLKVTRMHPDLCRKKPQAVDFNYSFVELEIKETVYVRLE